jgi:cytochrome c oxidase subunit II
MQPAFELFPQAASEHARDVDNLFFYLAGVSAFFTLLIAGLIVYFAVKYRRRSEMEFPPLTTGGVILEIAWTAIPLVFSISFFWWGARLYVTSRRVPPNSLEIKVIGRQWMWKLQHPTGPREMNTLHIPRGRPIRLTMISEDVIHSFFIPVFRVKMDVLPGRYTTLWFQPDRTGTFHLFCAEYCGTLHSRMIGQIVVMEPAAYENWLAGVDVGELPQISGEQLANQFGCLTCHGSRAPTFAGVYGSRVKLASGDEVEADDAYLRESILQPNAKVVAGFEPIMPSFRGQLTEEQVLHLIAYIKSQAEAGGKVRPDQTEKGTATK